MEIFSYICETFVKNGYSYECKKCFKAYECRIYIYKFIYNEFSLKKAINSKGIGRNFYTLFIFNKLQFKQKQKTHEKNRKISPFDDGNTSIIWSKCARNYR